MALKLVRRLPLGFQLLTASPPGRLARSLTAAVVGEPSSAGFRLTRRRGPADPDEEERDFRRRLSACSSSAKVLKLLRSVATVSGGGAAAALHRLADLEREEGGSPSLRDPSVLEDEAVRALCLQLECDSRLLPHCHLVSALLACTRLCIDPWSTLMVRLLSESQERLQGGRLSAEQLCTLGRALLAAEGPGGAALEEATAQIQKEDPSRWGAEQLAAVYGLLADAGAKHGRLLDAMHARAAALAPSLDEAQVSGLLGALAAPEQRQATPALIRLLERAAGQVPRFSDEQLAAVLAALLRSGHSERFLAEALERRVAATAFACHPETLSEAARFLGRRRILSPAALDALAESLVYRADGYGAGQLARQLAPFGKLGYLPPNAGQLFGKVESVLRARFWHFPPRALLAILHSCILVERFPVNFVSKVFGDVFLQRLREEGDGIEPFVLAQLTQLYMTVKLECPFYEGPRLHPKYRVKSFLTAGRSLETAAEPQLYHSVKSGLLELLGDRSYFASKVLTPYCYTLDVEIKLDEEGYVLPASHRHVFKRIALCLDDRRRFSTGVRRLLGGEGIKQRHLKLLGYRVVQVRSLFPPV